VPAQQVQEQQATQQAEQQQQAQPAEQQQAQPEQQQLLRRSTRQNIGQRTEWWRAHVTVAYGCSMTEVPVD